VLDAKRSGRPSKLHDDKSLDISDSMLRGSSKSLRKWAQEKGVGLATSHKAVRKQLKDFPYEVTEVQELKRAGHRKRIRCFTNLI
jgi:hypothetical protein